MTPRDYQVEFVNACHAAWERYVALLGVLPTGMGKTICFVEIASRWQQGRVLIIAPQIELVGQAAKKLRKHTGIDPAIEQAHNRSNETSSWLRSPFIVASRATLMSRQKETTVVDKHGVRQRVPAGKRYQRLQDIGLVIVDEAHDGLTPAFKEVLDHFRGQGAKILGVTATPKRADNRAMANFYDHCPYQMSIGDAVELGWLVAPEANCIQLRSLDLSSVRVTRKSDGTSDFNDEDLARVMEDEKVVYEIAEVTAREGKGLKTVVYCESIAQARQVAGLLATQYGLRAEYVSSKCTPQKRADVLRSFCQDPDGVEYVCNVGILTTGWDFPGLQHIVMARPTKSLSLYTQMVGRGTRPLEGVVDFPGSTPESRKAAIANSPKPTFKLTDLRDNSLEHKLVSIVDVMGGTMGLADEVEAMARKLLERSEEAQSILALIEEAKDQVEAEIVEAVRAAVELAGGAKTPKEVSHARSELAAAIKRAKDALAGDDRQSLRELIQQASEEQEEFERQERERLARLKATAEYHKQHVDPFDESQRGSVAAGSSGEERLGWSKFRNLPMSRVPDWFLQWASERPLSQAKQVQIKTEIRRRNGDVGPAPPARQKLSKSAESQRVAARLKQLLMEI